MIGFFYCCFHIYEDATIRPAGKELQTFIWRSWSFHWAVKVFLACPTGKLFFRSYLTVTPVALHVMFVAVGSRTCNLRHACFKKCAYMYVVKHMVPNPYWRNRKWNVLFNNRLIAVSNVSWLIFFQCTMNNYAKKLQVGYFDGGLCSLVSRCRSIFKMKIT